MNSLQKKPKAYIILFILIALQLFRIIYSFAFLREDYHSDEAWSYGLANSYYDPFIFETPDHTQQTHFNEWFSAEEFRNYLTVSPEQRFSYGSVFFNLACDNHPPLFFVILHTICSFFPGKFSFWYGFAINIPAFIILQFFLFRLSEEITESKFTALCTCVFFGFSPGALNMFVFVRMYAMLTMLAVISAYLHTMLFKTKNFRKYLAPVFAVTLAGILTHRFYLAYAGILSACFCIYYLIKKEYKNLLVYSVTLLSSVGASALIFPAEISHFLYNKKDADKYPLDWQFKYSFNSVLNELFGINIGLFKTPNAAIAGMAVMAAVLLILPLCFLFRKETWFRNLINRIKSIFRIIPSKLKLSFRSSYIPALFLFLSSLVVVVLTALKVSAIGMAETIDRYNFMVFPLIYTAFTTTLSYLIETFTSKKQIYIPVLIILPLTLNIMSNIRYPEQYLFKKDFSIPLSDVMEDSNIIYISNEHWLITAFTNYCLDSEMFYSTTPDALKNNETVLSYPDNDKPVYLIIKEQCLTDGENTDGLILNNELPNQMEFINLISTEELKNILETSLRTYDFNYIGKDSIFSRDVLVYRLR